jgi:hypothetical protein
MRQNGTRFCGQLTARNVRIACGLLLPVLASLAFASSAWAGFKVTDEHTGETFNAFTYGQTPYECAAPCAFTFTAVPSCVITNSSAIFSWTINGVLIHTPDGGIYFTSFHYDFPTVGTYLVQESEQTASCGTGGTFRLQVVDKTPPETTSASGPSAVTDNPTPTVAAPPAAPPDSTPPQISLAVAAQHLARVLQHGLKTNVGCSEACTLDVSLLATASERRQLKLAATKPLARTTLQLTDPGSRVITLKLTAHAHRALRSLNKATLTLSVGATDAAGNHVTRTIAVHLGK